MKPVLIDTNRTFGVELEGLINCEGHAPGIYDINTRHSPYYCECECIDGCTGECTGECECSEMCFCDEYQYQYADEHPEVEQDEIDNQECSYCTGDLECSYCTGDCECRFCMDDCGCPSCTGVCGCDVCTGQCYSCFDYHNENEDEVNGNQARDDLAEDIRRRCKCGCYAEDWNTDTKRDWKIIYDGSVSGNCNQDSVEVISPPLSGIDGLKQVEAVVQQMQQYGITVNRSTGLHVHHCSSNLKLKTFVNLLKFYAFYEGIIDSLMPKSRRGSGRTYLGAVKEIARVSSAKEFCVKIDNYVQSNGLTLNWNYHEDIIELCRFVDNERYCKINIVAFRKHGTIEFRHHSGTVDSEKVSAWIELTQLILNYCANPHLEILDSHVPSFYKMMIILKARKELKDFYKDRREYFNKQYGSLTEYCTTHKNGG